MAEEFPGFDGWEVSYDDDGDHHRFAFTKEHPAGKNGYLFVSTRIAAAKDPMIAYLAGVRDAYAEDLRVSPPDDRDLWEGRFRRADANVVLGKVVRGQARGFPRDHAVARLMSAGFSMAQIGDILGSEKEG